MGALVSILGFVSKLGSALLAWWHDKGIADAQQTKDHDQNASAGLAEVQKAQAARDVVAGAVSGDLSRVRKPDRDAIAPGIDGNS